MRPADMLERPAMLLKEPDEVLARHLAMIQPRSCTNKRVSAKEPSRAPNAAENVLECGHARREHVPVSFQVARQLQVTQGYGPTASTEEIGTPGDCRSLKVSAISASDGGSIPPASTKQPIRTAEVRPRVGDAPPLVPKLGTCSKGRG
jgi:hypothetical protein